MPPRRSPRRPKGQRVPEIRPSPRPPSLRLTPGALFVDGRLRSRGFGLDHGRRGIRLDHPRAPDLGGNRPAMRSGPPGQATTPPPRSWPQSYIGRADAAFETGHFFNAAALYGAALSSLGRPAGLPIRQPRRGGPAHRHHRRRRRAPRRGHKASAARPRRSTRHSAPRRAPRAKRLGRRS